MNDHVDPSSPDPAPEGIKQRLAHARLAYSEAMLSASSTLHTAGGAVACAHRCGSLLRELRAIYPEHRGGDRTANPPCVSGLPPWEDFLRKNGMSPSTCRRWMRLAALPLDRLDGLPSIRAALALLLDDGDDGDDAEAKTQPATPAVRPDPAHRALVRAARLLAVRPDPPDRWPDREALRQLLEPLATLHRRLSEAMPSN